MDSFPRAERVVVARDDVSAVEALYEEGLYLQAHDCALEVAPLHAWSGTAAGLIAGRLAGVLGAPRLARLLHLRAWREDRSSAAAAYFRAYNLFNTHGPPRAWAFLQRLPAFRDATPDELADLDGARCSILTELRDFEEAERALERARTGSAAHQPWLCVVESGLLKARDRYAEALAVAQEGLRLSAWYRPGVHAAGELLPLLGRDEEAIELLKAALEQRPCASFAGALASLQSQLGDDAGALASWQRVAELSPLMEQAVRAWWHGRISDARYALGELAAAADAAAKAGTPFFEILHRRLTTAGDQSGPEKTGQVLLAVPFVRQHHMTCAPATLSALSTYFGSPIDHLSLAGLICYDGTPDHEERFWFQENEWIVREFRVTWEAATALLDRGLPFTMVTMETQSAHLQAVIGYDSLRGTLLIRDPFERTNGEAFAEPLLERYASSGPRGMVMLPKAQAERLDGLLLPEAAEYDLFYQTRRALHEHRRPVAEQAVLELQSSSPGHRLTLEAERALASYDADAPRTLAATEGLLQLFPTAGHLLYSKLCSLRELGRTAEAAEFLRELSSGGEPAFWREWAQTLAEDAREHRRAYRWLARGLRHRPLDADFLAALGDLRWADRDFAAATELYRHAACLRDKQDRFAQAYLLAARHLREAERVIELLVRRFEQDAARSMQPARTLFSALSTLDRQPEAFARLEHALTLRPQDGELLLFAADAFGRVGDFERAGALLARAEGRSPRAGWLRGAATLADYRCDLGEALSLWREVLAAEPLAMDAQRLVTRLMAETAGGDAARAHLAGQLARFPHHLGLHRLAVDWARESETAAVIAAVEALLAMHPNDAWARREMALACGEQRRWPEAREQLAQAEALEPRQPNQFATLARVERWAGDLPAARAAARKALQLSIDHGAAMHDLMLASDTFAERRASIAFLREELIRQVVLGQGLLTYRELAFPVLEPAELLAGLREALAARPDLWHAWAAVVQQLGAMAQLDEALAIATEATERFPLLVQIWLELAYVQGLRRDFEGQVRPLRRALILQPFCGEASRTLATAHERRDDFAEAQRTLEQAIAAAPLDPENHRALAVLLMKRERWEEAAQAVERSLRLNLGSESGWELLRNISLCPELAGRALRFARELTEVRPAEARSWFRLAECLPAEELEARLAAIDQALARNPHFVDACDLRALVLAGARRWDEALAACAPPAWPADRVPAPLRGRRAWVEAESGDRGLAITHMRELLAQEPDFYWGWSRLIEWLADLEDFPGALAAAEQLSRLAPHSTVPLGWRASLLLRSGKKEEALPLLRRALELDPAYEYAALALFEQHFEAARYPEAGEVVARMKLHQPGPMTTACDLRLRCVNREIEPALQAMRQLCFTRPEEAEAVEIGARALLGIGQRQALEDLLLRCLREEGVNPAVGALWGRRIGERGGTHTYRALSAVEPATTVGKRAYAGYLEVLKQQQKLDELKRFLRAHGPLLRADVDLWAEVGRTFMDASKYQEAALWFNGWRERTDLLPWLLLNIGVTLRRTAHAEEAGEASRRALTSARDHTTHFHELWLAADAFHAQRYEEAAQLAEPAQSAEMTPFYGALRVAVNAGLAVQKAGEAERRAELRQRVEMLKQPPVCEALQSELLRPVYRRTLEVMAQLSGERFQSNWMPKKVRTTPPISSYLGGSGGMFFVTIILLNLLVRACSYSPSSHSTFATPFPKARFNRPTQTDWKIEDPIARPTPSHQFLPVPEFPPLPSPGERP